jgi:hypothetical protein
VFAGLRTTIPRTFIKLLSNFINWSDAKESPSLLETEQIFFENYEELGRDKKVICSERALTVADHHQKRGNHQNTQRLKITPDAQVSQNQDSSRIHLPMQQPATTPKAFKCEPKSQFCQ